MTSPSLNRQAYLTKNNEEGEVMLRRLTQLGSQLSERDIQVVRAHQLNNRADSKLVNVEEEEEEGR